MNWIELDEIDSTSLEVERHLHKGEDIAIFSHVQTAGRGQRGKSWESLSGNLHLSLGLFRKLSYPAIALVPLQISLILCELIRDEFGPSLTIKWPNDLLFAGAKVGGILCESKHIGDDTVLVLGIGINCNVVPEGVSYQVNCLSKVLDKPIDSAILAQKIASKVLNYDFCNSYGEFRKRYEYFALRTGHVYFVDNERYILNGYSEQGTLLLENNGVEKEEFSAGSERLWSCQRMDEEPFYLADIGNTNIKVTKSLASGKLSETLTVPSHSEITDECQQKIKDYFANTNLSTMFFSSVKPSYDSTLISIVPPALRVQPLRKRFVRLRSSYDLSQLGLDRLLAMEGALSQDRFRGKTLLIVSLGTALTLDAVDPDGHHLGGQIIPGIFLQANSLHQHTDLLPLVENPLAFTDDYGFSTVAAISSGIRDVIHSFLEFHRVRLQKLTGEDVTILATGGDADKVAENSKILVDKNLIFKGIRALVRAGA